MTLWDLLKAIFGGGNKPEPPAPITYRPVVLNDVPYPSQVRLSGGGFDEQIVLTEANGRAGFTLPTTVTQANLFIEAAGHAGEGAPGYAWYGEVVDVPSDKFDWWAVPIPAAYPRPLPATWYQLPKLLIATRPTPAEHGLLRKDGYTFRDETGAPWQWRGCTDFLLLFLHLTGVDIAPIVAERVTLGFNLLRVLGMNAWPETGGQFYPQQWPDYYIKLGALADRLATAGVRMEFVVFADAQVVMPTAAEQDAHFDRVMETLQGKWNVLIEVANEPFQNIPGGEDRAAAIGKRWQGRTPLLIASGGYATDDMAVLVPWMIDYLTLHTDRGPEWPRKQKDCLEYRWALNNAWPVVSDEPMGADEVAKAQRSNVPDDFASAAGVCGIQVPGGTFHSTDGLYSRLFRPVTKLCAQQWADALLWAGPYAQLGNYTAGHLGGSPIAHSDATALRTFASIAGETAKVVVVRPSAEWTPIPQNGWRIVKQSGPHGAFLDMVR